MTARPSVAAVTGSQRDGSHTATAVETALESAREAGAEVDHVRVADLDLPLFDPDRRDAGDAVELRRRLRRADAVLLGTPMYHGTFSSPLKTVLDYATADEFEDTVVGLLVVAGGGFPTPALDHLQSVVRSFDAWVLPNQVAIPNSYANFEDRALVDDLRERVETLGSDLVTHARVTPCPTQAATCAAPTGD